MPVFDQLPYVYAWQSGNQWFYVDNRYDAPAEVIEARLIFAGETATLVVSRATRGMFVSGAIHATPLARKDAR